MVGQHRGKYMCVSDNIESRSGLVESKLRHLVSKLEMLENIQLAHPFNKGFECEVECESDDEALRVASGLSIGQNNANGAVGDNQNGEGSKIKVYTSSFYIGLVLDTSECL